MEDITLKNNDRIGIIAHDAGASNLIKGWMQNQKNLNFYFCLKGPAINIFKEELIKGKKTSLENIIKNCNVLITGTSYISDHEHNARIKAKKYKILSIAVIDHWVNYELRFIRNNQYILPKIIWVFDEEAESQAKKLFNNTIIQRKNNFYIDNTVQKIKNLQGTVDRSTVNILYLLEPIRKNTSDGYPLFEFKVLDFFIKNLSKIYPKNNLQVIFRLHPSETKEKYQDWISRYGRNNFSISNNESLEEDLAWAEIVVGYESYALVIASASKRRCITTKLSNDGKCRLKIKNLEYLRDIN